MMRLLSDQDICKALYYTNENFLEQPNVSLPNIVDNNIFPYRFIPDVDSDKKTYITLAFNDYRLVGRSVKMGKIYIYIFTHKTLFKTAYGELRTDYLLHKIDDIMNEKSGVGTIGKPTFYSMSEFNVNDDYQGNFVVYQLYEWN